MPLVTVLRRQAKAGKFLSLSLVWSAEQDTHTHTFILYIYIHICLLYILYVHVFKMFH